MRRRPRAGQSEAREIASSAKADTAFYLLLTMIKKKLDSINNDGFFDGFDVVPVVATSLVFWNFRASPPYDTNIRR